MSEPKKCSGCGAELLRNELGGHCLSCLLQLGISSEPDLPPDDTRAEDLIGRIGSYKLLQQLGEGGCGIVYLAEQEAPVRRHVALKVIKLGMDTREVVARFEAERQALALMDHPNIAKVLDAGATESGRPYFVMELVEGIKITEYCDQYQLALPARLKLFIEVCQAVQHAHQKGIIHRDLKPSNILVIEQDGAPMPKVIDFGIAKATSGQRLNDKTLFTAFEQFLGTPGYMSPEQAGLGRVDIDTRTDIYSLGVLLYELLAGHPPFDSRELRGSAFDQILQIIRDKDPPRPSMRLNLLTEQELATVAHCRRTDGARLPKHIRGDLDSIVMKALEKERDRRYETANEFGRDLERYLRNEPVTARPSGMLYHLLKMVRRNRIMVGGVAAVFAALIFSLVVSVWGLRQEKAARRAAESALAMETRLRQRADARAKIAQADALTKSGNYDKAEQLLKEIAPSSREPDVQIAGVCRAVGIWRASQNQWQQAANYFKMLEEVNSLDTPEVASADGLLCGPALIQSGDTNGYEALRNALLTKFINASNPVIVQQVCRSALLLPASAGRVAQFSRYHDLAAIDVDAGFCDSEGAWVSAAVALIDYRLGNYTNAIKWCRQCLLRGDGVPRADKPFAQVVLAMSHYQLHHRDEADFELAYARDTLKERHDIIGNIMRPWESAPKPGDLFDWTSVGILVREATNMMGNPELSEDSPATQAVRKLDSAEFQMDNHNLDEAEKLISEVPARSLEMEGCVAGAEIAHLGWLQANRGRWQQAIFDYNVTALGPEGEGALQGGRGLSGLYLREAPLLLEKADPDGFEKLRQSAIKLFPGTTDPISAESVLLTCLLRPTDPDMTTPLHVLADTVAGAGLAVPAPPDHSKADGSSANWLSGAAVSLALLTYRTGENARTTEWLDKSAAISKGYASVDARRQIVAAMNECHLGHIALARSELEMYRAEIEGRYQKGRVPNIVKDNSGSWFDWWIDKILFSEAEALIEGNLSGKTSEQNNPRL